jgi:hypothetical protein
MFFHVDESGHTGTNLFDDNQPVLYYGVLYSKLDVDILAEKNVAKLREKLGVSRLHASELGNGGLVQISSDLIQIQKDFDISFDFYQVSKVDHALISFFDQVFDSGLNPLVSWTAYWTPLRYVLLLKVASLFDKELSKRAWSARIDTNDERAESELVAVCSEIRYRVRELPDQRSRQILSDALKWVEDNPKEIRYNVKDKNDLMLITPNIIGFQFVMHGIAARIIKHKVKNTKIIVDQQLQFNKSQQSLADYFSKARDSSIVNGPGMPEISFKGMPITPIDFSSSNDSVGLELVDIYIWVFRRYLERKELATELFPIIELQLSKGRTDEISLNGIARRWSKWFENLPEPTGEQLSKAKAMMALDEDRRLKSKRSKITT